ncbi:hypothetical protein NFI96_033174 [Prochilodus magdalenae]|nr:hypothetical protein NFI96_033174 [Prochilodus magdalenae]
MGRQETPTPTSDTLRKEPQKRPETENLRDFHLIEKPERESQIEPEKERTQMGTSEVNSERNPESGRNLRENLRRELFDEEERPERENRTSTYSDCKREELLGPCTALITPPEPTVAFNNKEPNLKEVEAVIKAARSSSAPGPSGVPYVVYKRCPRLLQRLWKIIKVIWRRGKVAQQWRHAEGVWIPKEENASTIEQFRVISLLSVECKKGGVPKTPGCNEHTGVVTQLIREAREGKGDLAVLWLDLANAYGSIPHKLVEISLVRHHVPHKIRDLILDYYNCFSLRVTSGTITFAVHRLEKGIITGCTISVILFALAMNMLKSAEVECTKSGTRQPQIRAYMDDLMVTTTSIPGCRWILQDLKRLITWARMDFKPVKSQSLLLRRRKVTDKFRFSL